MPACGPAAAARLTSARFSKFVIQRGTFGHELRKPKGTSNSMILVPLFDLKFLRRPRGTRCRNFKSAALAAMHALQRHQREHALSAVVQHLELDGAPDLVAGENADEVICTGDRDPVERQNDVAGVESRPFGRTLRLDAGDHHRALL